MDDTVHQSGLDYPPVALLGHRHKPDGRALRPSAPGQATEAPKQATL